MKKQKYVDDVWDILQKSYAKIGGIKGLTKDEIVDDDNIMMKLVHRNGKIVACQVYNTKQGGRKIVAGGTDGTDIGKKALYDIMQEDVKRIERGSWAEVSEAMEYLYVLKFGGVPIPVDIATKILRDKGKRIISVSDDGYHYTREIAGTPLEKIMFGNVPPKYRNTDDWDTEGGNYKTKFRKLRDNNA